MEWDEVSGEGFWRAGVTEEPLSPSPFLPLHPCRPRYPRSSLFPPIQYNMPYFVRLDSVVPTPTL